MTPESSTRGERGQDGQDGRDGQRGTAGQAGADGRRGDDGADGRRGDDGAAGRDGTSHVTRNQVLAVFVLGFVALMAFGLRSEAQASQLRRTNLEVRQNAYNQCQATYDSAVNMRRFIDDVSTAARLRPDLSPERKAALLASYESSKPRLVGCGSRPR